LVATLAFSPHVERGVFVGVTLAIGVHLYRELNVVTEEHIDGSTLTISPQGVLWFATVPKIERICRSTIADDPNIDAIVLDLSGVGRLDYTGAATLRQSITTFTNAGITVELINIPPGARRAADVHFEAPPD
jgi:SulP family sulfate permease